MFKNLARLDALRPNLAARTPAHSNDNHPNRRLAAPAARRLACRWQVNAATGRLECRWGIEAGGEAAEAPSRSSGVLRARPLRRAAA
jgi:hypothetical protein